MMQFVIDFLDLGPHWGFILACYFTTILIIGALFVWILSDRAQLRAQLAALEAQGVTRRSAAPGAEANTGGIDG